MAYIRMTAMEVIPGGTLDREGNSWMVTTWVSERELFGCRWLAIVYKIRFP